MVGVLSPLPLLLLAAAPAAPFAFPFVGLAPSAAAASAAAGFSMRDDRVENWKIFLKTSKFVLKIQYKRRVVIYPIHQHTNTV